MITDKQTRRPRWFNATALLAVLASLITLIAVSQRHEEEQAQQGRWVAAQFEPLVQDISLVGKIVPSKAIALSAPFEGHVLNSHVEVGQRVSAGQTLLEMDPGLVDIQLREALALQLKARRAVQDLQNWPNGVEATRARRAVKNAERVIRHTESKLRETQTLFERGIIARIELNDLQQQLQTQYIDLQTAKDELQEILKLGGSEYRQIADMELTNAAFRYEALRRLREGDKIVAPFNGVIVPVPQKDGAQGQMSDSDIAQTGARVVQGQALLSLADTTRLKIITYVSELDINRLEPGQSVEILGDGFSTEHLEGYVESVSYTALADDDSGDSALFPLTLSTNQLTPEQLQRVRIGMSARLSIVTYRNEQALIIPLAAIQKEGEAFSVMYRETEGQETKSMPVTLGLSTLDGVEVFGLRPGLIFVPQ